MRRVEPDAAKHAAQARGAAHTPSPVDVESLVFGNQPCGDSAEKQSSHAKANEREEGGDVWRERARSQGDMQGVLSAALQASGLLPSQAPTLKDPRPHPPPTSYPCLPPRKQALRLTRDRSAAWQRTCQSHRSIITWRTRRAGSPLVTSMIKMAQAEVMASTHLSSACLATLKAASSARRWVRELRARTALLLAAARMPTVAGRPIRADDGVRQCLTQRRRTRSTKGAEGSPRLPQMGRGAEDKKQGDAGHRGGPLQNTLRLK